LPLARVRGAEWLGKRGLSALSWQLRRTDWHCAEVTTTLRSDLLATEPDMIAVAGDLVNFSLDREFAEAAKWLEALGPPQKVIVTPGNHEALTPGWQQRMAAWGGYGPGPDAEAGYPLLRSCGAVALIAVSTAVATPPSLACGWVGDKARRRLGDIISEARAAGRLPVVLMHHPPTPITKRRKGLLDGRAVRRVLAESGAALVLHGHTHRPELSWIGAEAGAIPVLGVSSFAMPAGLGQAPGAWHLIELARSTRTWTATVTERAITIEGGVGPRRRCQFSLPYPTPCGARRNV